MICRVLFNAAPAPSPSMGMHIYAEYIFALLNHTVNFTDFYQTICRFTFSDPNLRFLRILFLNFSPYVRNLRKSLYLKTLIIAYHLVKIQLTIFILSESFGELNNNKLR